MYIHQQLSNGQLDQHILFKNNPVYLGSLIGYGFYGSSGLASVWDGVSYSGKTDGQVTNGISLPNQSGTQTRELAITNVSAFRLSYSNVSQIPPAILIPGGSGFNVGAIEVVQALSGTSGA